MTKVAFYLMNEKGFYVLQNFIPKFGANCIEYIICSKDKNLNNDHYNEIKALCSTNDIPFYDRSETNIDIENNFNGYKFTIGWRWIIKDLSKLIVFHDSLLPRYRGFAPLVNCLINNERQCGVTALFASNEYDAGEIIEQRTVDIRYPIKILDAIKTIKPLYFELISSIYKQVKDGTPLPKTPQDNDDATYSLWLDEEDYAINWSWSSNKIKRFVDAVGEPYSGATSHIKMEKIKIHEVSEVADVKIEHRERHIGKVIFINNNIPTVVCADGLLQIHDIRDTSGNSMKINLRSRFC